MARTGYARTRISVQLERVFGVMAAPKFATKLSEATDAGEKFVQVFYETFDRRRQVLAIATSYSFLFRSN